MLKYLGATAIKHFVTVQGPIGKSKPTRAGTPGAGGGMGQGRLERVLNGAEKGKMGGKGWVDWDHEGVGLAVRVHANS